MLALLRQLEAACRAADELAEAVEPYSAQDTWRPRRSRSGTGPVGEFRHFRDTDLYVGLLSLCRIRTGPRIWPSSSVC